MASVQVSGSSGGRAEGESSLPRPQEPPAGRLVPAGSSADLGGADDLVGRTKRARHVLNAHIRDCYQCPRTQLCEVGEFLEGLVQERYAAQLWAEIGPQSQYAYEVDEDGLGPLAGTYRCSHHAIYGASLTFTPTGDTVQGLAFAGVEVAS